MSEAGRPRDIADLARWTVIALAAQAGLSALAVAIAAAHGPGFVAASPGYALVALLVLLAFVVAGGLFLRWTYLTAANARAFGAEGLRYGPGLAVGSYFLPIANLALPLQSLRDVWKASVEPRDWEIVAVPPLLGFWWFFWLTSNIAGIAAYRLESDETLGTVEAVEMLTMVSDGLTAAASLLLILVVRRLTALQEMRAAATALA